MTATRPSSRTSSPPAACTRSCAMADDGIRSPVMGRVIHFEIHAGDPDRAERFYTGVFGWTAQAYGGPTDYRLLSTGEDGTLGINGAILKRMGDGPASGDAVNA